MIPCGILPPLITPLLGDDQLDAAGLERLVEHVLAGGVHGLFLLGTTGEGPSLSYRLRREIIERLRALVVRRGDLYRIGQPHACSGLKGIKCALSLKGICRDLVAAPSQPFEEHQKAERAAVPGGRIR